MWATGRLLGRQATNWVMMEDMKAQGFMVGPGFSGTPVWDTQLQGVVGMVVAASRPAETKTAFVLPLDVLVAAWPLVEPITRQRVFLSAAPADAEFADRLRSDLESRDIVVWSEQHTFDDGQLDKEEHLRRALRAAQAVVVVVSSQTRSSRTVKEHLRLADLYQRRLILVWVGEEEPMQFQQLGWRETAWIDTHLTPYLAVIEAIEANVSQHRSISALLGPVHAQSEKEQKAPRNPYRGLRPFTADNARDFFGRDRLVEELVKDVQRLLGSEQPTPKSGRILTIIGPSGSGKSSVVMAGLLPRLQQGALPESEDWVYLEPMVPGKHPIEALGLTIATHFPDRHFTSLREDLEDDAARGLHVLAMQLAKQRRSKVVLLVDQFEELFTQTETEDERQRFIDLLTTATIEPRGLLLVLLTLRADFSHRLMQYPELYHLIQAQQRPLLPMEVDDLRTVIEQPAALPDVQLTFEGNLVGDLLFEVQGQVGALPLLQFTLDQLFQRRTDHTLTLAAYHEIGGVKGALAKQAESTYTSLLSEEHRKLARSLFLRLIDPGITEQDTTRRRAHLAEISLPDARQTTIIQEVADAFVVARLLTANEIAGTTTVEVSHEALIREWPRLADWLREGREDIHLQQAVSEDAAEWEQRGKPRDRLYRGSQLKDARAWARRNIPSRKETVFLHASAVQRIRFAVSLLAIVLLLLSTAGLALRFFLLLPPDPTIVTTLNDSGPGSLRQAIATVKPGSTITFDANVRGIIRLTGDLNLTNNLTIRGPGAGILTISSNNGSAKIHVSSGTSVSISGLTFKATAGILNEGTLTLIKSAVSDNVGANSNLSGEAAGGITNLKGTLTLINCTISGNKGSWGGGIYNAGKLSLINSTVLGNSAMQFAGGIYNFLSSTLILTNSTVSGNTAQDGGGIENDLGAVMTITNSTVSDNEAGSGGGIVNRGQLMLSNSTISDNTVKVDTSSSYGNDGGGILNDPDGQLTLINSTLSDNTAGSNGGGIAVYSRDQNLPCKESECHGLTNIIFCTIYGNTAARNGGGIAIGGGHINGTDRQPTQPPRVGMRNSIVAYNHAQTHPNISGTLTSYGYNLIQDDSGATINKGKFNAIDLIGVSPNLGPLQNNGGPTKTLSLLSGSPAIDYIPPDACHVNGISTDQRGMKRPDDNESACDIGVYESP